MVFVTAIIVVNKDFIGDKISLSQRLIKMLLLNKESLKSYPRLVSFIFAKGNNNKGGMPCRHSNFT